MKIVVNKCFGGFSLSPKAVMKYAELSGFKVYPYGDVRTNDNRLSNKIKKLKEYEIEDAFIVYWIKQDLGDTSTTESINEDQWFHEDRIERDDKNLVKTIQFLKSDANGMCASLEIVQVPKGIKWQIEEYDGMEHVSEQHRTW